MNPTIQEMWISSVINNTRTPMNWQVVADEFALSIITQCVKTLRTKGETYGAYLIEKRFEIQNENL